MKKTFVAAALTLLIGANVGAQVIVDPGTRTVRADYSAVYPNAGWAEGGLDGRISTADLIGLSGGNPVTLVFQVALGNYPATTVSNPFNVFASGGTIATSYGLPAGMAGGILVKDSAGGFLPDFPGRYAETYFDAGPGGGYDPYNDFQSGFPRVTVVPGNDVFFSLYLSGFTHLDQFGPGSSAHLQGSISLTGVTAYDAAGNVLGNASFYDYGSGTFGSTPEPGSLALLGTGLVGLVPMIRRRGK